MKVLLIGNGIDIQFGGNDYYNDEIIKRAINNVTSGKFRTVDYPAEIVKHLHQLFDFAKMVIIDPSSIANKVWTEEDKISMANFLLRCEDKNLNNVFDIGFEDYFLIQRIFYNYTYDPNVGNYIEREKNYNFLRRFFLDAIYNNGKINCISYPSSLKDFFNGFDQIYCLNYDLNIKKFGISNIYYLHGAFHILHEKYNNNSPMNKAMGIYTDSDKHEYLYSTALTTYCGKEKTDLLEQADKINNVLKYAMAMKKEAERTGTKLHKDLQRIFDAYTKCPGYEYPQNYCYNIFEKINGEITILGMSPFNDDHIIKVINDSINKIIYYYYPSKESQKEKEKMQAIFKDKDIEYKNVKDFWAKFK